MNRLGGWLFLCLAVVPGLLWAALPSLPLSPETQQRLGDYGQHRMNEPALSGIHYNEWIVVYSRQDQGVYLQNCRQVRQQLAADHPDEQPPAFRPYPPGTTLIKESYQKQGDALHPRGLYVMIKGSRGSAPPQGDWQYLQWRQSQDDQLELIRLQAGGPTCSHCHLEAADKDYVFATQCAEAGFSGRP